MSSFEANVRETEDGAVVTLAGELDLSATLELEAQLDGLERGFPRTIVIDLRNLGFIDSSGLATLIEALQAGRIAGAGLDVFEPEPPSVDNPLLEMPNVVCTPHSAARTPEALRRCAEMTQRSVLDLLEGRLPEYTVNRNVRWRALS